MWPIIAVLCIGSMQHYCCYYFWFSFDRPIFPQESSLVCNFRGLLEQGLFFYRQDLLPAAPKHLCVIVSIIEREYCIVDTYQ